jgi:phage gp45-like
MGFAEQLGGRLASMWGFARVAATKALEGKGIRVLQVRFDAAETRDNTQLVQHYGFGSRPKVGADVVVAFIGGNRSLGLAIASNDRRFQVELQEGEVVVHDDQGQKIHIKRGGIEINGGGKPVTITNLPLLKVDSDIQTTGKITSTGDQIAGTISQQHHTHTEVQRGGEESGPPKP